MSRVVIQAEALVSLLWGVQKLAGGWLARCPLHPDSGFDLFVHATPRSGQAVVSCRYRCTLMAIVDEVHSTRPPRTRRGT